MEVIMNKKTVIQRKANGKLTRIQTRFNHKTTLSIELSMNDENVKISVPVNEVLSREGRRHLFDEIVPLVSKEFDKMNDYDAVTSVKVKRTAGKSKARNVK